MKKTLLALFATSTIAFASATIVKGTTQVVTFTSTPEGASVVLNGNTICTTPCSQNLKKDKFTNVTFKKDGYNSVSMPITTSIDATVAASVVWDLGTTDAATGAAYEYAPDKYHADLKKKD